MSPKNLDNKKPIDAKSKLNEIRDLDAKHQEDIEALNEEEGQALIEKIKKDTEEIEARIKEIDKELERRKKEKNLEKEIITQESETNKDSMSVEEKIIDALTVDDYMKANPTLTEFGKKNAVENKEASISEVQEMAKRSFEYLDGKISAKEYLTKTPYRYSSTSTIDWEKYAEEESLYFKQLRRNFQN